MVKIYTHFQTKATRTAAHTYLADLGEYPRDKAKLKENCILPINCPSLSILYVDL